MPGITKRKYVGETMSLNKSMQRPLYLISEILPKEYDGEILFDYFMKYYPNEWNTLVQMHKQYSEKDMFLQSKGKKARYRPMTPEKYFFSLPLVKNILSDNRKEKYKKSYDEKAVSENLDSFEKKRGSAIAERKLKIESNTKFIQDIDPLYIDFYISEYHKNGTSTEKKIEIVKDLSKYNSNKINTFFYKLNDAEQNNQVRQMTFKYLQDRSLYAKLRKNFKGKKKTYQTEKSSFNMTPEDLFKKLQQREIQAKKKYNIFISHSFVDQEKIIKLYKWLNTKGYSCYCDWTSDSEFLKRNMISKYTEEVLKKRIEQSNFVVYAKSDTAEQSKWVAFELEYTLSINKYIKTVNLIDIDNDELLNSLFNDFKKGEKTK